MFEDKCRVCLQPGIMISIFKEWRSQQISEKLMSIVKIQIHPEDGLPSTICKKCLKKLDNCIDFIKLCENSDIKLRTLQIKVSEDYKEDQVLFSMSDSEQEITIKRENKDTSSQHTKNETEQENTIKEEKNDLISCGDNNSDEMKHENIKSLKKSTKQQCFTCGKIVSSKFRLKTHLKTHSGERPFACPHCTKTFSLAQYLKVHIRIHTGEKPFKCSECDTSFAHTSGLAAHMRKHTGQVPYCCVLCPQRFRTFGHLQYHLRQHTGEKNFECDSCGRAFITRSQLKQHLASHSGDRPHVCCMCGVRLTRASHLRRHMSHVHNSQRETEKTGATEKIDSSSQSRCVSSSSTSMPETLSVN